MALKFNRQLLAATGTDSGALDTLGTVIHRVEDPGTDQMRVVRDGNPVGQFFVTADPDSAATQAVVDLAQFTGGVRDTASVSEPTYTIHPGGVIVLHVSRGRGGYHVRGTRMTEKGADETFDSRTLPAGDVFVARPFRTGTYRLRNTETDAAAEVVVHAAEPGALTTPADPVTVRLGEEGDEPTVEPRAGQGVAVHLERPGRIVLERAEPEPDRPRVPSRLDLARVRPVSKTARHAPTYLEGVGSSAGEGLASAGFERVADLARADVEAVAEAMGASTERAHRVVDMARLVTLGADKQLAEVLVSLGLGVGDLRSADPDVVAREATAAVTTDAVSVPADYTPDPVAIARLCKRARQ